MILEGISYECTDKHWEFVFSTKTIDIFIFTRVNVVKEIVIFLTKCVVRNQELVLGKLNLK